ncbi:MAG: acyl-ACP thioesterase domain-containing protein, partial [Acidimicrobiales bacterium]
MGAGVLRATPVRAPRPADDATPPAAPRRAEASSRPRRPDGAAPPLPAPPAPGARTFGASRRVRLGDVRSSGGARLEAIARYLQDIAADDVRDAAVADDCRWVVRRTRLELRRRPRYEEPLELTTWCSGTGGAWAERRTSIVGAGGAAV